MKILTNIFAQVPENVAEWSAVPPAEQVQIIDEICKDLETLLREIGVEFKRVAGGKAALSADEMLSIFIAILPEESGSLANKTKVLAKTFPDNNQAAYGFVNVVAALDYKNNMNSNLSQPTSAIMAEESKHDSDRSEKAVSQGLDVAETVAENLLQNSIAAKMARAKIDIDFLNKKVTNFPDYIKNAKTDNKSLLVTLEELNKVYMDLVSGYHEDEHGKEYPKHLDAMKVFYDYHAKLMTGIFQAIDYKLIATKAEVSATENKKLKNDFDALLNVYGSLINLRTHTDVHFELVEKFDQDLSNFIQKIEDAPKSEDEISYRRKRLVAEAEAGKQFPRHEYSYLLGPGDLQKSANEFMRSQVELTQRYSDFSEDSETFIFSGRLVDNLAGIQKDVERNLKIAHQECKDKKGEDLKNLLIEKFGATDAVYLIRNYDQGQALMISAAVSGGNATDDIMEQSILIRQADENGIDIYAVNGVVYREAVTKFMNMHVPEDENKSTWKFKANVKALSVITKDGFLVLYVGTDSAFLCATFMQKSNYINLEKMVAVILQYERQLNDLVVNKKGDVANAKVLIQYINDFKDGAIAFDQLVEMVRRFNSVASSQRSIFSALMPSFKKDSPSSQMIALNFHRDLAQLRDTLEKVAKPYDAAKVHVAMLERKTVAQAEQQEKMATKVETSSPSVSDMWSAPTRPRSTAIATRDKPDAKGVPLDESGHKPPLQRPK